MFVLSLGLFPLSAFAYNFLYIHPTTGEPLHWEAGTTIRYYVDPGPLGRLTNEQARTLLRAAMDIWENASPNADVPHFEYAGLLPEDVNGSNYQEYISKTSCYSDTISLCNSAAQRELTTVIVFDEDDSILDNEMCQIQSCVAAAQAGVFSGSSSNPQNIVQGLQVYGSYLGLESTKINTVMGLMVHELGHLLGLAHTSVNQQAYIESLSGYDQDMPTMFFTPLPIFLGHDDTTSVTLNPDDIAGISTLYPSDTFAQNTGIIQGKIEKSDGTSMGSVNVIARNVNDPLCVSYSFLSGRECEPSTNPSGNPICIENNSNYFLRALPPATYTLEVEEVANSSLARTLAPGLFDNYFISGDAEFWNEGDQASEANTLSSTITVTAGEMRSNIDIILNRNTVTTDRIKYIPLNTFIPGAATRCPENPPIDYAAMIGISEGRTGGIAGSSGSGGLSHGEAGLSGSAGAVGNTSPSGCSLIVQ